MKSFDRREVGRLRARCNSYYLSRDESRDRQSQKEKTVVEEPTAIISTSSGHPIIVNRTSANESTMAKNLKKKGASNSKKKKGGEETNNIGTGSQGGNQNITTLPSSKNKSKTATLSASSLATHRKWQDAAESRCGKGARIVVSKPAAKKLIFDILYEAFRPMNKTQIYEGLKAIVPSPVLHDCLEDMVACSNDDQNLFFDSDDEQRPKKKKSKPNTATEEYSGSLLFKTGRNVNSNLYYVDHTKLKATDQEERNALANKLAIAKGDEANQRAVFKTTLDKANKLYSEPTNEVVIMQLENEESAIVQLEEKLVKARALKVNEKYRQKTKQKIQRMSANWRKRKRLCMDFLICLEENTDGSVSIKKSFAGEGPIAVDSDEAVAKSAVKFAKDKKSRGQLQRIGCIGGSKKMKSTTFPGTIPGVADASLADESFVAVVFNSQQTIRRVYVDDDKEN